MPYNSPMKKKGSSCVQMKDHKGKPSGLMMEGSAMHMSMLHQETDKQEKENLEGPEGKNAIDDKASAMEMSPYKMGHESPAEFTGMSGGSALHDNHGKIDPKTGKMVDEFGTTIPEGFESSMSSSYNPEEPSSSFFDDVRKADKAVNILQNVYDKGTSEFGYTTGGSLGVLTGGPTSYSNYLKRIKNLRSKVDSDPRQVLSTINRNISNSGSDAARVVAKEIDPTGIYANANMYGQSKHYGKDDKQDPRFVNISGQTKLEKKKSKKS